MNKSWRSGFFGGLAVLAFATMAWALPGHGRVTASKLNMRRGPGTEHPVVGALERGQKVQILGERGGWLEVAAKSPKGAPALRGWVSGKYVERRDAPADAAKPGVKPGSTKAGGKSDSKPKPKGLLGKKKSALAFVLDPKRSALELLGPAGRGYLEFDWHRNDYPGSPKGPNEAKARALAAALKKLCPERRVNTGEHRLPFDWKLVEPSLVPVPGEAGYKLNRHAAKSYVRMRAAAAKDGVSLRLVSAARSPKRQKALAKSNKNGAAVARGVSTHNYGLAIDLAMSPGAATPLKEVTTRPFSNVMAMRSSPVHKWMLLFGKEHGWYPYTNEPWHWEHNPASLRRRFP